MKKDLTAVARKDRSSAKSRAAQSRRGPFIVGVLVGAGITTFIQSFIWSIQHTNNSQRGNSSLLAALEESKKRHSRLVGRKEVRRQNAIPSSSRANSTGSSKAQQASRPFQERQQPKATNETALDDDDLAKKLRSVQESQFVANQRHMSPFQQRMAAHQERMRLIREQQQQQQNQVENDPQEDMARRVGRLRAGGQTQKSPENYNARQRKTLPKPGYGTVIDWEFQPIESLHGDPFGMAEICDASTKTLRSPNASNHKMVCIQGKMPNFTHPMPKFLPGTDMHTFLRQPENQVAIKDDWVDWSFQTCVKFPLQEPQEIFAKVDIGGITSFQHFHDNALGLIYQARQAFDLIQSGSVCGTLPEYLEHHVPTNTIVAEEWTLMGFQGTRPQKKVAGPNSIEVGITFYSQDFDQVRVHPAHVDYLRRKMPVQTEINPKKVVYISRQGSNSGVTGRQFKDEAAFETKLLQRIPGAEKYRPGRDNAGSVKEVFERIGDACLILGVHGGHMYNQYFTGPKTAALELMAVTDDGLFHGQRTPEQRPVLAHRAIWHNANLIRQPYWRLHFPSLAATNFELDDSTMDKIAEIVKAAGCDIG